MITTARQLGNSTIAGRMFARWCQENNFAYMMKHHNSDGLIEYGDESFPGTRQVVNPRWRELDKAVRQTRQSEKLLVSSADIQPDAAANTLTVKINRMASPFHDPAIAALLDELNQQEFQHPETKAEMAFVLV